MYGLFVFTYSAIWPYQYEMLCSLVRALLPVSVAVVGRVKSCHSLTQHKLISRVTYVVLPWNGKWLPALCGKEGNDIDGGAVAGLGKLMVLW